MSPEIILIEDCKECKKEYEYVNEKDGGLCPECFEKERYKQWLIDKGYTDLEEIKVCGRHREYRCENKKCKKCFENSFANCVKAVYWNEEENGDITPRMVAKYSNKKYWFKCNNCNHRFDSGLNNINNGRWCPYCSNQKLCDDDCKMCFNNSFSSHPNSIHWHPTKNGNTTQRMVFKGSHKKYWFICNNCNHEFDSSLGHVSNGKRCPYCSNKKLCEKDDCKICFKKSFASDDNSIHWHPMNMVSQRMVAKCSNNKYWFKCDKCIHDFDSVLSSISNGTWCPYCCLPVQKLCEKDDCKMCFKNSFSSHPNSIHWHPMNMISPRMVAICSNNKYWFKCDKCNHDFDSSLAHVSNNRWCPYCCFPVQKLCEKDDCKICFKNSFASYYKTKHWHLTKNGDITPRMVSKYNGNTYWFKCDKCNHDFDSVLGHVSNGTWCPYCCVPLKKLCEDDDCKQCFENSFASHLNSIYWHPTKNGNITPRMVAKCSGNKYWFKCDKCNHDFDSVLSSISNGTWCPYCCDNVLRLCEDDDCKQCFENSFASHINSIHWHPMNMISPRMIIKGSNYKYWFKCNNCNHEFNSRLSDVSNGTWCPYCCFPIRKLCEDDDCKQCFENSFASHINSIHWHPMNMISPRMITKSSGNKYWFKCDNCIHIFYSSLGHVSNGTWCPYCVNKTEGILLEYLKKYENVISQFKVEWCKNKSYLPFDFCLPEFKLIIELDGRQHFRQVSNWTSPEECHKTDCYKMKQALVNGYSVIRLLQIDVFYNTYDWKMELTENIEKIKKENTPQVIFMGGEEEYENMRKEMN